MGGLQHCDHRLRQRGFTRWGAPGVVGMTLLALAFSVLTAWIVWAGLVERFHEKRVAHFALESAEIVTRVDERFRGYRQILRGARGLFAATGSVDRRQWEAYVALLRLDEGYPGIQAMGYAMAIRPEALARHVAQMRAEGFADYRVWPAGARELHTPVVMLEPFGRIGARALGFDAYSEPVRREAMDDALAGNQSALSGNLSLMTEIEPHRRGGVQLFLPVFATDAPAGTEAERREAVLGWVFASFRVAELMRGVLERYTDEVRVVIYDRIEAPEALLYDSHPAPVSVAGPDLSALHRLDLNGREWLLRIEALPGFPSGLDVRQIELMAIVAVGLLFVVATWSLSVARERARALARTMESLRRSETQYGTLVNLAHEGIASTDDALCLTFVNPRLAQMLGVDAAALIGRPLDDFWHGSTPQRRAEILSRLRRGQGARYEVELQCQGGGTRTALMSDAALLDEEGRLKGATVMVTDISERKEAERRIQHLATHDMLTGVPNRAMFTDLLSQAIGQARRYRHKCALLFIDLDRFKEINDEYGHLVGDQLLVEAVGRMQASIRTSDTLGRQGGDEFVVLLPEIESRDDAEVVAEKIRNALEVPFVLEGQALTISSSIGIALFPEHAADEDALLRCADDAMYSAKSEGRNRTRYYAD